MKGELKYMYLCIGSLLKLIDLCSNKEHTQLDVCQKLFDFGTDNGCANNSYYDKSDASELIHCKINIKKRERDYIRNFNKSSKLTTLLEEKANYILRDVLCRNNIEPFIRSILTIIASDDKILNDTLIGMNPEYTKLKILEKREKINEFDKTEFLINILFYCYILKDNKSGKKTVEEELTKSFFEKQTNSDNDFLLEKLHLPKNFNYINSAVSESFYGRKWLINALNYKLKTEESLILIHSAPGIGKTTLVKHLESTNGNILCAIYCESNTYIKNIESMLHVIIYQMCQKNSSYDEEVCKLLRNDDSCLSNINDTINVLLINPISKLYTNSEKPIIIIDSLDSFDKIVKKNEGDPHISNSLINEIDSNVNIKFLCNGLMKHFRFILTFNSSPHLINYFNEYPQIKIASKDSHHIKDIQEYLYKELVNDLQNKLNKDEIIKQILECSEGSFLYTYLLVKEIKCKRRKITDKYYPKGLNNFFLEFFKKLFRERPDDEYENKFVKPLAILSCFPEGIPCQTLRHACKWTKRSEEAFLMDFPYYVKREDSSIRIIYKHFINFLNSENAELYCLGNEDKTNAKQAVLDACFSQVKTSFDNANEFEIYYLFKLLSDKNIIINNMEKQNEITKNNRFYHELIIRNKKAISEYDYTHCRTYLEIMNFLLEKTDNININIHLLEGKLAEHNGMLKDAKKEYEQGIYIYETTQNKNEIDYDIIFDMYSSLAFCLYRLTDYSKAINTYKTLLDFTNSSEKSTLTQLIDTKIDLANVFRIIGDYNQALTVFKELDTDPYKKELISNPRLQYKKLLHEAWTKRNTMANDSVLELYKKAKNLYENNSECICKNDLAKFQNNIALVYMVKKEFEDAHAKIDDAIKLYSKIHGEDSLPISDFYITQGDIYKEEAVAEFKSNPSKIDEAKKHFKAARDSYDKANKIRILKYEYNVNNSKDIDVENGNYNLNLIVSLIRLARLEILQIKLMPNIYKKNDYEIKVEYIKGLIIQVREINDNNKNKNETSRNFYDKIIKETEERFEEL